MHQLVSHPDIEKVDFSSFSNVGSGAAYLPSELLGAKLALLVPREATFNDDSFLFYTSRSSRTS